MKTVLEPETHGSTSAASPATKVRESRVNGAQSQQKPDAAATVQPGVDTYESCLDLAALFLPRG
jgi:hypothetical protein